MFGRRHPSNHNKTSSTDIRITRPGYRLTWLTAQCSLLSYHLVTEGPVYTKGQYQCCDNTSDTVLTKSNGVASERDCNPFLGDSIVFNEDSIASIITVVAPLTLTLGVKTLSLRSRRRQCLMLTQTK